jgi:hypothetical protein
MEKKYLIFLAIAFASCVSKTKENLPTASKINVDKVDNSIADNRKIDKIDSILIENKIKHVFSDKDTMDQFYICIKGKTIHDGTVTLRITKGNGVVLLNEEFPSYLLMGYDYEGDVNSRPDREKFMISRIKSFFDDKHFASPAIQPDDKFDENLSDKDIWDEISADKNNVGFFYILGEGDGRKIAYSKKMNKAVLYFNCC